MGIGYASRRLHAAGTGGEACSRVHDRLARLADAFACSLQPRQGPFPGHARAGLVVASALVAVKAVSRVLVDVDVAIRALLLDRLDVGERDALVLVAEMQLRRTAW